MMSTLNHKSYVHTYIKVGDDFLEFQDFDAEFPNPYCLDGAIDLVVDGQQLHGFDTWDLINGMWSALIRGMLAVSHGTSHSEGFPDCSITLVMRPVGHDMVHIEIEGIRDRKAAVTTMRNPLFRMLCSEARSVVAQMHRRLPQHAKAAAGYDKELDKIEAVIQTLN